MKYAFESSRAQFADGIAKAIAKKYPGAHIKNTDIEISISIPDPKFGDLSCSIALRIGSIEHANPGDVAKTIAEAFEAKDMISKVDVVGGYINAWLNEAYYAKEVLGEVSEMGDRYGSSQMGSGIKVIVESPSVNPNKSWHIGHLKSALLGDIVSRSLSFCGYDVERENYIDDLGLQMAEITWGYMNVNSHADKKFDQWLGEQYVQINKMLEDKSIKDKIAELLKKMEEGGTLESATSRDIAERCVKAQYETARNYNISHDVLVWEGDIVRERLVDRALEIGKEKGILEVPTDGKYKGCIIVNLGDSKLLEKEVKNAEEDKKVLIRSNGTATYIAKDFAFHLWKLGMMHADFKFKEFMIQENGNHALYTTSNRGTDMAFGGADIVVNVIGSAQRLQQLILKALVNEVAEPGSRKEIVHLSYGEVGIIGGTLSGRTGGWMGERVNYTADDLLGEMKAKALELIEQKNRDISPNEKEAISKEIALSAIRFEFLRQAPEKKIEFSWEKALNFSGNSGPYCMYMYARAAKILSKEISGQINDNDISLITRDHGFELVKMISYAHYNIEKACREYRPNILVEYMLALSASYSKFYENSPILKGGDAKNARLAITRATKQTLSNLLVIIGVTPLENV